MRKLFLRVNRVLRWLNTEDKTADRVQKALADVIKILLYNALTLTVDSGKRML